MLELQTLGMVGLRIRDVGDSVAVPVQPKRLALLTYLALAGRRRLRRRDLIVAFFWPELDEAHARGALRQALRGIRRSLGDSVLLSQGEEEVGVNGAELWCDAVAFAQAVEGEELEAAMHLYQGDFLSGLSVTDAAPELDEWIAAERARLRESATSVGWRLSEVAQQGSDWMAAVSWGRRAVALRPQDELATGRLIALLARSGDRAGALAVYEQMRRWLETEFHVSPSPASEALVAGIRANSGAPGKSS